MTRWKRDFADRAIVCDVDYWSDFNLRATSARAFLAAQAARRQNCYGAARSLLGFARADRLKEQTQ
jgi:hypothetical protein